jgi:hypothetical protein
MINTHRDVHRNTSKANDSTLMNMAASYPPTRIISSWLVLQAGLIQAAKLLGSAAGLPALLESSMNL